ncbi:hypothetical protein BKA93DRAFT_116169 [Sparassis latifolia]
MCSRGFFRVHVPLQLALLSLFPSADSSLSSSRMHYPPPRLASCLCIFLFRAPFLFRVSSSLPRYPFLIPSPSSTTPAHFLACSFHSHFPHPFSCILTTEYE